MQHQRASDQAQKQARKHRRRDTRPRIYSRWTQCSQIVRPCRSLFRHALPVTPDSGTTAADRQPARFLAGAQHPFRVIPRVTPVVPQALVDILCGPLDRAPSPKAEDADDVVKYNPLALRHHC